MKKLIKYIVLFLVFGVTYYLIEVVFNGHSNWSSIIMGGVGGILISLINFYYSYDTPKWKQITLTTFVMIFIELSSGLLLRALGFEFWDYSHRFLNVEGLICLRYSLYWLVLSPIAIELDDLIEWTYFGGHKPDGLVDYTKKLVSGH